MTALAPQAWNDLAERASERTDWPFELSLGVADLDVVFRTDLRRELLEVAATVVPHLEARPRCGATAWSVMLIAAPDLPAPGDDGDDVCIAHSPGCSPLRGRRFAGGGWRWVYNPRSRALIGAHREACRVAVMARATDGGGARRAAIDAHAALRLIVRSHLLARGGVVLHAAVVQLRGVGVALLGNKGSGKSALQLGLLARQRAGYVAGDRCFAYLDGGGLRACGWPSTFRPTVGSLALVPGGDALIDAAQRATLGPDDKIELGPADAARRLGIDTPAIAELHGLLGPRFVAGAPGWALRSMTGRELIDDHSFPVPDPAYPDWLGLAPDVDASSIATAATRAALAALPACELRGGGSLDDECAVVERWCASLDRPRF